MAGAVAAAAGTWVQLLARQKTTRCRPAEPALGGATGPIFVLSGRPGEAATGLLSAGTADQAASRLMTFTRYARSVCEVRPALAPIVTSAMVTAEHAGTYTVDLPQATVDDYLRAVRKVGASLLLQVQPGRAPLGTILERWAKLLAEPDVGIFFDLRSTIALADQRDELDDAVGIVRRAGGDGTLILVRGVDDPTSDAIVVPETIDLRRPGTRLPHNAVAAQPRPCVLAYH